MTPHTHTHHIKLNPNTDFQSRVGGCWRGKNFLFTGLPLGATWAFNLGALGCYSITPESLLSECCNTRTNLLRKELAHRRSLSSGRPLHKINESSGWKHLGFAAPLVETYLCLVNPLVETHESWLKHWDSQILWLKPIKNALRYLFCNCVIGWHVLKLFQDVL